MSTVNLEFLDNGSYFRTNCILSSLIAAACVSPTFTPSGICLHVDRDLKNNKLEVLPTTLFEGLTMLKDL